MIKLKFSTWVWILTYVVVLSAPLIGGVFNLAHGRGFWLNFSVALGFVALSMFGGQFVLVSRMQWVTRPMGMDALMAFHKRNSSNTEAANASMRSWRSWPSL